MVTPNQLTAFRVLLALISPLLLIWSRTPASEVFVMILFTIACITDWWDGYLARTKSMVTSTGKIVDPIADKLLILGLMATFCYFGLYSFGWILLIFLREIVVTAVRLARLQSGKVIPAEWAGKVKLGFQIGSVYASFLFLFALDSGFSGSFLFGPKALNDLGILLANVVTVVSGCLFFYRLGKT